MPENVTVAAINDALKVVAEPRQRKQYNDSTFLHTNLKKKAGKLSLGGRQFELSLKTAGGSSWRTLDEMEALPAPGAPRYKRTLIPTKTAASVFSLSVQAMWASKGQEKAWIDAKQDTMDSLVSQFAVRMNQMFFRWGAGAIARIQSITDSTKFIVFDDQASGAGNTFGNKYAEVEMYVSATASALINTGKQAERLLSSKVTNINEATREWTVDPAYSVTHAEKIIANDYLYWGDKSRTSKNRDFMGLMGVCDDGTLIDVFQSIQRTAAGNAFWKGNRRNSVASADLENIWRRDADDIERRNNGSPDVILTTYGVNRRFFNSLKGQRSFVTAAESGKFKGGFRAVAWQYANKEIPVVVDKDCPTGTYFMLDWSSIYLAQLKDAGWLDEGEGILKWDAGVLAYVGVWYQFGELVCDAPNKNAVGYGVTED